MKSICSLIFTFLIILPVGGCASYPVMSAEASEGRILKLNELKLLLASIKNNDSNFDSSQAITVAGPIDLKYRGQQVLSLGDDCLQLVMTDSLSSKYSAKNFSARITGVIKIIRSNSDSLYPWYSIDGINVYPRCNSDTYFVVSKLNMIK